MSSGKVLTSDDVQLAFSMTKMLLDKLSTKKQIFWRPWQIRLTGGSL